MNFIEIPKRFSYLFLMLFALLVSCLGQTPDASEEPVTGTVVTILDNDTPTIEVATPTLEIEKETIILQKSEQKFSDLATYEVAFGDLDGDGDLDAVFANMKFNHSRVWLNDGAGFFEQTEQKLTKQGHGVRLGDLDGDGDLDAVIICATYNGNSIPSKIYFNDGLGYFTESDQDLGNANTSDVEIEIIDYDNDGDLDIHVLQYPANNVIYLNDGDGLFSIYREYPYEEIEWGDLNADGVVDMFVRDSISGQMYRALINDGTGIFTETWKQHDPDFMKNGAMLVGDFDGDGFSDIFIARGDRDEQLYSIILFNNGDSTFEDSGQRLPITKFAHLRLGDINEDGFIDIFIANALLPDQILLNDGQGNFADSGLVLDENMNSKQVSLGDIDMDGDLDIIVGSYRSRPDFWFNTTGDD